MFMIYRDESATADLQRAWEQADEPLRGAILRASRAVDRQLCRRPQAKGESRGGRTRVLFRAPVAVTYEVDEARKLVTILRAWAFVARGRTPDRPE